MKIIFLTLLLAVVAVGQGVDIKDRVSKLPNKKDFKLSYDKFKDITSVTTEIKFRMPRASVDSQECNLSFAFKGEKMSEKPTFWLGCNIISSSWQFLRGGTLRFLLDTDHFELIDDQVTGTAQRYFVYEYVDGTISRETLEKFAVAENVEMQAGVQEMKMNKKYSPRFKTILDLTQ